MTKDDESKARDAQHAGRHDMDDVHDLQHEGRHDIEEEASGITRAEVADLIDSVEGLEEAIVSLNKKMDRQWAINASKRKKLAAALAIYTLVLSYGIGSMIDQHVKECMVFGSVIDERTQWICDVTIPFHDHHPGGISDQDLEKAIERAVRLREGR